MPLPSDLPLANITTFIFDVDGVLTDGTALAFEAEHIRRLNSKDAYALQHAARSGYRVCIISGGDSVGLARRLEVLGLQEIHLRVPYKLAIYDHLKAKYSLQDDEIAYMGDDMPDIEILERVGLPCIPADAAEDLRGLARYISPFAGGMGCARELIESVMKAQGRWFTPDTFRW
jgi:3-deoxy-D-manno-octulosonate 8-phosphate phosphatase (KDO 8-P phosphatase)